jgi:hypothetical protein
VPGLESWQKILLKRGPNEESGLQCWRNLLEKVNGKKIELNPISPYNSILKVLPQRVYSVSYPIKSRPDLFEVRKEVPMKWLYLALILFIGLFHTDVVQAQETQPVQQARFPVTHNASVCIDPPEPSIVVGSEKDKVRYPGCIKWSAFTGASEVFESYQFMESDKNKVPPVNRFAQAVISSWTGVLPSPPPTSMRLYDNPKSFGLTEVAPDDSKQSRAHTLIVWNADGGGMIAYVVDERKVEDIKKGASDLARYLVLYTSETLKGELRTTDAATLARSLEDSWKQRTTDEGKLAKLQKAAWHPRFLRRQHVRLYWNQWIQDESTENERSQQIYAGQSYNYYIDLSALDYQAFVKNPNPDRNIFKDEEADALVPQLGRLNVTVFPIGGFSQKDASTAVVKVDTNRLRNTLTSEKLKPADTLNGASKTYGALFCMKNCEDTSPNPRLFFSFTPKEAGCAHLAVVIWNANNTSVVASWVQPINVLPNPADLSGGGKLTAGERTSDSECESPMQVAQRFDVAAVPRFDPQPDSGLSARLTFLDFESFTENFTMGFFEVLQNDGADKQAWVLETKNGLRRDMAQIKKFVDDCLDPLAACSEEKFDLTKVSQRLEKKLFHCKGKLDPECSGISAQEGLMQIARKAGGGNPRVEATFRDTKGALYYLPIHLLRIDKDKDRLLADAIQIRQPLPIHYGIAEKERPCISNWFAGLIVQDMQVVYDKDSWREKWPGGLKNAYNHCEPLLKLTELRDYFRLEGPMKLGVPGVIGVPEGLVLLAHHGAGRIAERENQPEVDKIGPEDIKRIFGQGSFAVLAACSVGAMSEDQRDNSLFLHTLNENHVRAAIVSPFKVPAWVAKRFLSALQKTLITLTIDTTLYDVFEKSKKLYQEPAGDGYDDRIPMANLFMLVGDGDMMICKPK